MAGKKLMGLFPSRVFSPHPTLSLEGEREKIRNVLSPCGRGLR
jgi:hypothetical protein